MKTSKEILQKSGLLPRLKLGRREGVGKNTRVIPTGKHTVKVLEDKIIRKPPMEEGDDGYWVRYIVEEDGVKMQYDTRMKQKGGVDPSYFVQEMANIEPGETITLEMKKAGIKNYIEIIRIEKGGERVVAEGDEEDEPEDDGAVDALADMVYGGKDPVIEG